MPLLEYYVQASECRLATVELPVYEKPDNSSTLLDQVEPGEVIEVHKTDHADFFLIKVQHVEGYIEKLDGVDAFSKTSEALIEIPTAIVVTVLDDLMTERVEACDSIGKIFRMLYTTFQDLEETLETTAKHVWTLLLDQDDVSARDRAPEFFEQMVQATYATITGMDEQVAVSRARASAAMSRIVHLGKDDLPRQPLGFCSADTINKLSTLDVAALEGSLQTIEDTYISNKGPYQPSARKPSVTASIRNTSGASRKESSQSQAAQEPPPKKTWQPSSSAKEQRPSSQEPESGKGFSQPGSAEGKPGGNPYGGIQLRSVGGARKEPGSVGKERGSVTPGSSADLGSPKVPAPAATGISATRSQNSVVNHFVPTSQESNPSRTTAKGKGKTGVQLNKVESQLSAGVQQQQSSAGASFTDVQQESSAGASPALGELKEKYIRPDKYARSPADGPSTLRERIPEDGPILEAGDVREGKDDTGHKYQLKKRDDGHWQLTQKHAVEDELPIQHQAPLTLQFMKKSEDSSTVNVGKAANAESSETVETSVESTDSELAEEAAYAAMKKRVDLVDHADDLWDAQNNLGYDVVKGQTDPTEMEKKVRLAAADSGSLAYLYDQLDWKEALLNPSIGQEFKDRFNRFRFFKQAELMEKQKAVQKKEKQIKKIGSAMRDKNIIEKKQGGIVVQDPTGKSGDGTLTVATFYRRSGIANNFIDACIRFFVDDTRRTAFIEEVATLMNHPPHMDGALEERHQDLIIQKISEDVIHNLKSNGVMKKMVLAVRAGEYEVSELYAMSKDLYELTRNHPDILVDDIGPVIDYVVESAKSEIARVEQLTFKKPDDVPKLDAGMTQRIDAFFEDVAEKTEEIGKQKSREDVALKVSHAYESIVKTCVKMVKLLITEQQTQVHTKSSLREVLEHAVSHIALKLVVLSAFEYTDLQLHDEIENPKDPLPQQILTVCKKHSRQFLTDIRSKLDKQVDEDMIEALKERLYLEITEAVAQVYTYSDEHGKALEAALRPGQIQMNKMTERSKVAWAFQRDVDILLGAFLEQIEMRIYDDTSKNSNISAEFEKTLQVLSHHTVCAKNVFYADAGVGYQKEMCGLFNQLKVYYVPDHTKQVAINVMSQLCAQHAEFAMQINRQGIDSVDRVTLAQKYEGSRTEVLKLLVQALALTIRRRVEATECFNENKDKIEKSILLDCAGNFDLAYDRVEHLLSYIVWKLLLDFMDSVERGLRTEAVMSRMVGGKQQAEAIIDDMVLQLSSALDEKVRSIHIRDALLLNGHWQNKFVEELGGQLRLRYCSYYGTVEQQQQEAIDRGDVASSVESEMSEATLMREILSKFVQTEITAVKDGNKLPNNARVLNDQSATFVGGPGSAAASAAGKVNTSDISGMSMIAKSAKSEKSDGSKALVSIVQSRDQHTVVSVKAKRTRLVEVVGINPDTNPPKVEDALPHKSERDVLLIIPNANIRTRKILEELASFIDLQDALSLLGTEHENDGTILETMKIVLLAPGDYSDETGIVDLLACSGFITDGEQMIAVDHEMDTDVRLLEGLTRLVCDPELAECIVIEPNTQEELAEQAAQRAAEAAAKKGQKYEEAYQEVLARNRTTGDNLSTEQRAKIAGWFQQDDVEQPDDYLVAAELKKGVEPKSYGFQAVDHSKHYKQAMTTDGMRKHMKKLTPTTSQNVSNFTMMKAKKSAELAKKTDYRMVLDGIAEHCVAGILGESVRGNETLHDVLQRVGVQAVFSIIEKVAATTTSEDKEEGEDANFTVLEEIGQFATRQALGSGDISRDKSTRIDVIGKILHKHARLGANKFLEGTNQHLKQLGVADLLAHESNVAVKAMLVTLFGRGCLKEFNEKYRTASPDDPMPIILSLEWQAVKAIVTQLWERGELRLKHRAEVLSDKRDRMHQTFRQNLTQTVSNEIAGENEKRTFGISAMDRRRPKKGCVCVVDKSGARTMTDVPVHSDLFAELAKAGKSKLSENANLQGGDALVWNFHLNDHLEVLHPDYGTTSFGLSPAATKDAALLVQRVIDIAKSFEKNEVEKTRTLGKLAVRLVALVSTAVVQFAPNDMIERNISLQGLAHALFNLDVIVERSVAKVPLEKRTEMLEEELPFITISNTANPETVGRLVPITETEVDSIGVLHDIASGAAASITARGLMYIKDHMRADAIRMIQLLVDRVMVVAASHGGIDGEVLEDFRDIFSACVVDEVILLSCNSNEQKWVESQLQTIEDQMTAPSAEQMRQVEVGASNTEVGVALWNKESTAPQHTTVDVVVAEVVNSMALEIRRSSELYFVRNAVTMRNLHAPVKLLTHIKDEIDAIAMHPDSENVHEFSSTGCFTENDSKNIINSVAKDVVTRRVNAFVDQMSHRLRVLAHGKVRESLILDFLGQLEKMATEVKDRLMAEMVVPLEQHLTQEALPSDINTLCRFIQDTLKLGVSERRPGAQGEKALEDTAEFLAHRVCSQIELEFSSSSADDMMYEMIGILTEGLNMNAMNEDYASVLTYFITKVGARVSQNKFVKQNAIFADAVNDNEKGLDDLVLDDEQNIGIAYEAASDTQRRIRSGRMQDRSMLMSLCVRELKALSSSDSRLLREFCSRVTVLLERNACPAEPVYRSGESVAEALKECAAGRHHNDKIAGKDPSMSVKWETCDDIALLNSLIDVVQDVLETQKIEAHIKEKFIVHVTHKLTEHLTLREMDKISLRVSVLGKMKTSAALPFRAVRKKAKQKKDEKKSNMESAQQLFEELRAFVISELDRIGEMNSYEVVFLETQNVAKKIAGKMDILMEAGVVSDVILSFVDAMENDLFVLLENALHGTPHQGGASSDSARDGATGGADSAKDSLATETTSGKKEPTAVKNFTVSFTNLKATGPAKK